MRHATVDIDEPTGSSELEIYGKSVLMNISVRDRNARCPKCHRVDDPKEHECGNKCKNCGESNINGGPKCFIQKSETEGGKC